MAQGEMREEEKKMQDMKRDAYGRTEKSLATESAAETNQEVDTKRSKRAGQEARSCPLPTQLPFFQQLITAVAGLV